jgi:hypothetical protein
VRRCVGRRIVTFWRCGTEQIVATNDDTIYWGWTLNLKSELVNFITCLPFRINIGRHSLCGFNVGMEMCFHCSRQAVENFHTVMPSFGAAYTVAFCEAFQNIHVRCMLDVCCSIL